MEKNSENNENNEKMMKHYEKIFGNMFYFVHSI